MRRSLRRIRTDGERIRDSLAPTIHTIGDQPSKVSELEGSNLLVIALKPVEVGVLFGGDKTSGRHFWVIRDGYIGDVGAIRS